MHIGGRELGEKSWGKVWGGLGVSGWGVRRRGMEMGERVRRVGGKGGQTWWTECLVKL